jgi:hypothetical protein
MSKKYNPQPSAIAKFKDGSISCPEINCPGKRFARPTIFSFIDERPITYENYNQLCDDSEWTRRERDRWKSHFERIHDLDATQMAERNINM